VARSVKRSDRAVEASEGKSSFRLFLLLIVLGVGALLLGRRSSGPATGEQAADFSLPVVAGTPGEFRLAEQRGKPVLVEVFASWCGVCRRTAPTVGRAAEQPRKRDVRFVGISVDDSAEEARRVALEWRIPYDVLHDTGQFARSYHIESLPTFVLIGDDGRVLEVNVGALSEAQLERWMGEVGAERL
jgi:thiol-disulfide isomerase/thioredoxin